MVLQASKGTSPEKWCAPDCEYKLCEDIGCAREFKPGPPAAPTWYIWETGGGCTAWRIDLSPTRYLLITQGLSHILELNQEIELGLHDQEANCLAYTELDPT